MILPLELKYLPWILKYWPWSLNTGLRALNTGLWSHKYWPLEQQILAFEAKFLGQKCCRRMCKHFWKKKMKNIGSNRTSRCNSLQIRFFWLEYLFRELCSENPSARCGWVRSQTCKLVLQVLVLRWWNQLNRSLFCWFVGSQFSVVHFRQGWIQKFPVGEDDAWFLTVLTHFRQIVREFWAFP